MYQPLTVPNVAMYQPWTVPNVAMYQPWTVPNVAMYQPWRVPNVVYRACSLQDPESVSNSLMSTQHVHWRIKLVILLSNPILYGYHCLHL